MASERVQRWPLTVSAYEYSIVHKVGKAHANAVAFSGFPLPDTPAELQNLATMYLQCKSLNQLQLISKG